jgi:N-acetylneuraminic acid mutarotase
MKSIFFYLFSLFLIFNSSAQIWTQIQDYPGLGRDDGTSFVINNKAYCFSGVVLSGQFQRDGYVLDANTEIWSPMASLPLGAERQYATGFSDGVNGYVLGGLDPSYNCLNDFWQYNVASDTWTQLPNFPGTGRQGMCHFVLGNKVYIIGGRLNGNVTSNEVWQYDFVTTIWSQKSSLPFSGIWRGAGFAIDSSGYVCYGKLDTIQFNRFIYKYHAINDTWSQISNITLSPRSYIGAAVCNGKACLYGGQDSLVFFANDLLVFNPIDSSMSNYFGLPTLARKGGMAFSMNNIFYFTTGIDVNYFRIKETWKNDGFVTVNQLANDHSTFIYPNPVANVLCFKADENIMLNTNIEIYDALGTLVLKPLSSTIIDVTSLKCGVYFLKIKQNEIYSSNLRFIKINN